MKLKVGISSLMLLFFIPFAFTQTCNQCQPGQPFNSGLQACFPFNNNTNDASGNDRHGTPHDIGFTSDRFSLANKATSYNGGYIDFTAASFQSDQYTYSLWVNIASLPASGSYYSLISLGNNSVDQAILLSNNSSLGHLGFSAASYNTDFSALPSINVGSLPTINTWYHVVMMRSNTLLSLYVNGNLISSLSTSGKTPGYGTSNYGAFLGKRAGAVPQFYNGRLDDVRIYNRILSQNEVVQLYSMGTDVFNPDAGTDKTVCYGDSVQLNATGGSSYAWMPSNWLNNPNVANPKFKARTTTKYYVTIGNGVCSVTDSVTIRVDSLGIFSVGADTNVCRGDSIRLLAQGANSYTWTPSLGLSSTTTANPKASPLKTIDYIVKGQSGICFAYDTIRLTVCDCSKSITYDTIKVYDTVTVYQQVYDTVTVYQQVYDTIKYAVADTLIIDVFSGINNPNTLLNALKIYPNPAHDELIIDNGNYWLMPNYSLQISNSLGQIVFLNAINQQQFVIATGTLGGVGTYFLRIISPNQQTVETRKIIIR